jgi:hypothetical protein
MLFFLSCTCSIRVVTLHWPDIFLLYIRIWFLTKISFSGTWFMLSDGKVSIAPEKLSNCLKRAETSVVLIVFDCGLCEVRAYKFISIKPVTVSYRRSTWIKYQKKISWSETKYKCIAKKYLVNAMWLLE